MARLKVAVLISGRGSNLQSLIDACANGGFPAEIVRVISNEPGAHGLARAEKAGIAAETIDHRAFPTRAGFEERLSEVIRAHGAEFVCLAGFLRVVTETFVRAWHNRLVNIHPSLLPAFRGLNTHARAIEAGVRFAGCTLHFVRAEMDAGPIIVQAVVPVKPDDTPDALAERVLAAEHRIYPMALGLIGEGRVRVVDEVVYVNGSQTPNAVLLNPTEG